MAASHPGDWPRNQQFAHAHQVHCRQPSFVGPYQPIEDSRRDAFAGDDDVFSLDRGLKIIENRAESFNRFIQAYRQLAQLPPPALQPVSLHSLVERAIVLETRVAVQLKPGPDIVLQLDPDQIEQLIINLLRNAAEAALARFPEVPCKSRGDNHLETGPPGGGHFDSGQRDRPHQSVELICALLHHEAGRERHRSRACAANMRSPRRRSSGRQSRRRSRLRSRDPPAAKTSTRFSSASVLDHETAEKKV